MQVLLGICHKHLRTVDDDMIERAFRMALKAHEHDKRSSGEPYFDHPYAVALIVAREIPLDDISVASALLHDVVEDTRIELNDIREEFGNTVADIVDGVTKITDIFRSHEITQAESYRKLLISMVNDVRVMLVKFADRLQNMRTIEYLSPEQQQRIARETLEIYAPFAHRFGMGQIKWELEDLSFKVLYPAEYRRLANQLNEQRRERERYIKRFSEPIRERLEQEGLKFEIMGRAKHLFSIFNKMRRQNKPLEEIYDLFAIRIILETDDPNDCFLVYGIVTQVYQPVPERFKNYISLPKKNGYRSIHTTVAGLDGRLVEVQIRTREMDAVAEKGIAAHWLYKEDAATKSKVDKEIENWVSWVREIVELRDEVAPLELMENFKLNLYQDEIYVFTPKGDLKILPRNATPVDFAYEIHSEVGNRCIGAKVHGKIVPLNSLLKSGDQVEIITSKSQTPNPEWEKFVVTHKAKMHIRKWVREEQREKMTEGRELWLKKLKKNKAHISEDELLKLIQPLKFETPFAFYLAIAEGKMNPDDVILQLQEKQEVSSGEKAEREEEQDESLFQKFLHTARDIASNISIGGSESNVMHRYASCCNPIPGDEIIGFVTVGEGIKIHRRDCKNINTLRLTEGQRFVDVEWPRQNGAEFLAAIHLAGRDRSGLLNDITHAISNFENTNIRSVNIDTRGKMFDGRIIISVRDTEHLKRVIEKMKKISGVEDASRFLGA